MYIILLQISDSLSAATTTKTGIAGNVWFWIAIAEFLILLISTLISWKDRNSRQRTLSLEKGVSAADIDFSDIIGNSFLAPELYKTLMRACHPDRFMDTDRKEAAAELTLLISQNQYSVPELNRLGKIAEDKLNIKIF